MFYSTYSTFALPDQIYTKFKIVTNHLLDAGCDIKAVKIERVLVVVIIHDANLFCVVTFLYVHHCLVLDFQILSLYFFRDFYITLLYFHMKLINRFSINSIEYMMLLNLV